VIGNRARTGGFLVLWPTRYRDNAPASLSEEYKDSYRALIAMAYYASGDVARARSRLVLLRDADIAAALISQAQRSMMEGRPEAEVRALSLLGLEIASGDNTAPQVTLLPTTTPLTPPTSLPTSTPTNTGVPTPVVAWTPTLANTPDSASLATSQASQDKPATQSGTPTPPTSTFTPPPTFTIAPLPHPHPPLLRASPSTWFKNKSFATRTWNSP